MPKLYTAEQVRRLDSMAINDAQIAGFELMSRAARAVYERAHARFPDSRHWLVLCGAGNNAGDGYLVACLARKAGLEVSALALSDPAMLKGDAAHAWSKWQECGGTGLRWEQLPEAASADLVIDGLLGTGLDRPLQGDFLAAVEWANAQACPRVAIDIPTGLHADSGRVLGAAVRADLTVTLIGRKRGQFTADGPDHCGKLEFDSLDVPASVLDSIQNSGILIGEKYIRENLPRRLKNSNKGHYGHVLVCGGAPGMGGAVRLAGEATLRSGAGLVSIATHEQHAATVWQSCPELMVSAVTDEASLDSAIEKANLLAIGPGLGSSEWSRTLFDACLGSALRLVVDADGLNWLARYPASRQNWVLTPHPGEAGRLLGISTDEVQQDRFSAALNLARKFNAVVVLKGCGTIVTEPGGRYTVCSLGNAGMATAGAGDVLTGIIAGLWAQGLDAMTAACLGTAVHAAAGDCAMRAGGQMSLIASDITRNLGRVLV